MRSCVSKSTTAASNMVQTRSRTSSPIKRQTESVNRSTISSTSAKANKTDGDPLRLVVVPKNISSEARFICLRHPRDLNRTRFLFCPSTGLYELTKISTSPLELRSILFTPVSDHNDKDDRSEHGVSNGYVNKNAEYITATPYDLAFLLIRILGNGKNKLFQPMEDLLETEEQECKDFRHLTRSCPRLLATALESICDTVEAGDEKMYRYNEEKVVQLMLSKAEKVVTNGLPKSMEERFITRPLEMPLLSIKREDTTISLATTDCDQGTPVTIDETVDSQSSVESSTASVVFSEISTSSTTTTITTAEDNLDSVPANILHLQRLRTAFRFIISSYLSPTIASNIELQLQTLKDQSIDWTPLNDRISRIAAVRAEAAASRSFSDFSRKRGNIEDDEDALANAEARAEKKRRLDEEEKKRKANLSRGVRDLAKVDVKGMKKMSDFFTKKPAAAVKAKT